MANILHLEDDERISRLLAEIAVSAGHVVTTFASVKAARNNSDYDLYICGTLGKYSDGLVFALDMLSSGNRVLVLSEKQKFAKVPFLNIGHLGNKKIVIESIEEVLRS